MLCGELMKYLKLLFIAAIFTLAFLLPCSFAALNCDIETTCSDAGEVRLFRISAITNAHAGNVSGSVYTNYVCCRGVTGLGTNCLVGNWAPVIRISGSDNAHAENPVNINYANRICISGPQAPVDCQLNTTGCPSNYACVARISGNTNAHVANCSDTTYSTRICCRVSDCQCSVVDACCDGCNYRSTSTQCNAAFACSAGSGIGNYGIGGNYSCQGYCNGAGVCNNAGNCNNCGNDVCVDPGNNWNITQTVTDNNTCSGASCLSDNAYTDYCSGDTVYERTCSGKDVGADLSFNCNNYDTSSCLCSVSTSTLRQNCDNWTCGSGRCLDSGSDWTMSSWSCSSANDCSLQACIGTNYRCYFTNAGAWTWSSGAMPIETACNDGFDNDCEGVIREWDYDTMDRGPAGNIPNRGDSNCPVGITAVAVSNSTPCPNSVIDINCTATVGSVNSIIAFVDSNRNGRLDAGDINCVWVDGVSNWTGNIAKFKNCSVGPAGLKNVTCAVNTSKSYQSGGNVSISITPTAVAGCCSGYLNPATCEADSSCDWCYKCNATYPRMSNPFNSDMCVVSNNCAYSCSMSATCGATCDGSVGCPVRNDSTTCYFNGACGSTSCNCSYSTCAMTCEGSSYCRSGDYCYFNSACNDGSGCTATTGQYCPAPGTCGLVPCSTGTTCYYGNQLCNATGACNLSTCSLGFGYSCDPVLGCNLAAPFGIAITVIHPYVKYGIVPLTPTGEPNFTKTMPIEFLVTAVVTQTGEKCNNNNCNAFYDIDGINWKQMKWDEFSKAWHEAPSSNSLGCDQYHDLSIKVDKKDGSATNTTTKSFFINCREKITVNPMEKRIALGESGIALFNVTVWNPKDLPYDYELKMEVPEGTIEGVLEWLEFIESGENNITSFNVPALSSNSSIVYLNDAGRTGIYQIVFSAFDDDRGIGFESTGTLSIYSESLYEFGLLYLVILMLISAVIYSTNKKR